MAKVKHPVALVIMDGFGINPNPDHNAVAMAKKPNLDRLFATYSNSSLEASGEAVGLMAGQMGDSNVGHLNIGAGRIVYQDVARISKAVKERSFFENRWISHAMEAARDKGTALHLLGLVSPGGVHSHTDHLYALLDMAKEMGLRKVFVHAFLDGRDVPPSSAHEYIKDLEGKMASINLGRIASVSGRYYAMDRDKRWDRVKKAYDAIVHGQGRTASSGTQAVQVAYGRSETDEFVVPTVVVDNGHPVAPIKSGDSVIFFNFRSDRARQLSHAFVDDIFPFFDRGDRPQVTFVCMTRYDETIEAPFAFPPQDLANVLASHLSKLGLKQFHTAETEKYAHVTFFFNGGEEEPFPGEDRLLIPSPKVATYDLLPEMSAPKVAEAAADRIKSNQYDFVVVNFANCDMVGHTGILEAAIKAVEAVDAGVGRVVDAMLSVGGRVIITADHGNAEQMLDYETGEPHTAHTTNPVPVIVVTEKKKDLKLRGGGILADLAPTVLELMGIVQPEEMTGKSIIREELT